jgi:hypothetical protein
MLKKKNLAKGTLSAKLLIGGTSLVLQTDEGLKFPDTGSGNTFAGVIWGDSYASPELDSTSEFVVAYRSSGDTFTIVRAKESTSAKQWEVGDNFMLTASAAVFDEYENAILAIASQLNPVGTIREFNVSTNPATLLGFGTWEAFGTGKVTVAIDADQTEFNTVEKTGGEKTHLLTSGESGVPAHNHNVPNSALTSAGDHYFASGTNYGENDSRTSSNNTAADASSAHNNLQPYIVVYRWIRTA